MQPDHAAANYQLGVLLQADGQLSEAAEHYETSLRSDPDQVDVHVSLAGILVVLQRPDEAVVHYQEALKQDRRNADIHVRLGWALATVGRLEAGDGLFSGGPAAAARFGGAHLGIGNVLLTSGHPEQAAEAYQRGRHPRSESGGRPSQPGLLDAELETMERWRWNIFAMPCDWRRTTRPHSAERPGYWPRTRMRRSAIPQQAVAWAELAWQVTRHQDPHVADVLAAAYAATGRFEQAVEIAEQALQLANSRHMDELAAQVRQHRSRYIGKDNRSFSELSQACLDRARRKCSEQPDRAG